MKTHKAKPRVALLALFTFVLFMGLGFIRVYAQGGPPDIAYLVVEPPPGEEDNDNGSNATVQFYMPATTTSLPQTTSTGQGESSTGGSSAGQSSQSTSVSSFASGGAGGANSGLGTNVAQTGDDTTPWGIFMAIAVVAIGALLVLLHKLFTKRNK